MRVDRRFSAWLIAGLLLLAPLSAAWGQTADVTLPDVDACVGGDVYVPIFVNPVDTLTSLDLAFTYDDAVLSLVAIHQAPLLSSFTLNFRKKVLFLSLNAIWRMNGLHLRVRRVSAFLFT